MKIGLLSPSIYMSMRYSDMIFAPRDLSVALANGLVNNGHEVHFFTAPDIKTNAKLVSGDMDLLKMHLVEEKLRDQDQERQKWGSFYMQKRNYELDLTQRCYKMVLDGKLDIVHSYHDTIAHFFDELAGFPTIYTLHDPLPINENGLSYWLLNKFSKHKYVSISNAFRKSDKLKLNFVQTVYHGIKISEKEIFPGDGGYLVFMGRMTKEKGIEFAIEAAKLVNIPIKIATSSLEQNEKLAYYHDIIEPSLNSSLISFVEFLGGNEKDKFLGGASCFLFPIQWEEPFGMVMIEAMACGTPVIAYNRGSVSEIVRDGLTGFIIDPDDVERPGKGKWVIKKQGVAGLAEAINRIGEIDRKNCRKHVEENFSIEKMIDGYERVYKKIIG